MNWLNKRRGDPENHPEQTHLGTANKDAATGSVGTVGGFGGRDALGGDGLCAPKVGSRQKRDLSQTTTHKQKNISHPPFVNKGPTGSTHLFFQGQRGQLFPGRLAGIGQLLAGRKGAARRRDLRIGRCARARTTSGRDRGVDAVFGVHLTWGNGLHGGHGIQVRVKGVGLGAFRVGLAFY